MVDTSVSRLFKASKKDFEDAQDIVVVSFEMEKRMFFASKPFKQGIVNADFRFQHPF